ncbi:MAG TPA: hypothetical protein VGV65_07565 [Nocardioides sp.]|nr:hypothetical protein [Nocardioides sp.]
MTTVLMHAVVSLDGFVADLHDDPGTPPVRHHERVGGSTADG